MLQGAYDFDEDDLHDPSEEINANMWVRVFWDTYVAAEIFTQINQILAVDGDLDFF